MQCILQYELSTKTHHLSYKKICKMECRCHGWCKHQFKCTICIFSMVVHHAAQIYRPIFVVLFMWSMLTICLTMLLIQTEIVECGVLNKYIAQCELCVAILYYISSTLQIEFFLVQTTLTSKIQHCVNIWMVNNVQDGSTYPVQMFKNVSLVFLHRFETLKLLLHFFFVPILR